MLMAHTNLQYDSIPHRTIPQLQAILNHLGKHIQLKLGIPFDEGSKIEDAPDRTVDATAQFVALFKGI